MLKKKLSSISDSSEAQKTVSWSSLVNKPFGIRQPSANALKPLLLFEFWSYPGVPIRPEPIQPAVDAND